MMEEKDAGYIAPIPVPDRVPDSLAPWFPEYVLADFDPDRDATMIIERALEHGDRHTVRWLFGRYGESRVRMAVVDRGARHLSPRALAFWCLVLGIAAVRPHPWPEVADAVWRRRG